MRRIFDFSNIAFWIGLILFVFMAMSVINQGTKNYELQKRADKLEAEIAVLENDKQQLGYKILYYKTDSYKEKLAREKLGLQLPGESVVIIPSNRESHNESADIVKTNSSITAPSNFEQWIGFLFGS